MIFLARFCEAQWIEQTISLQQGWNAVFLEVEPYPKDCQILFQDMPVKSVWHYDQRFSSVQFILDPSELTPNDPQWYCYFPTGRPEAIATNLYTLDAGKAYLIEMEQPYTWSVKGRPLYYQQDWNPDSYNLVGFHVDSQNPPSFATWFTTSAAHQPLDIWRLDADDQRWVQMTGDSSIEAGKAYWVMCRGNSHYQGPVEIRLLEGRELRFERDYVERFLEIHTNGAGAKNIVIEKIPSEPVPLPAPTDDPVNLSPIAGDVPMRYYGKQIAGSQEQFSLFELPATVEFQNGEASPQEVRLTVDRSQMTPYSGVGDALYQNLLVIRDGQGYKRIIGINSRSRYIPKISAAAKVRTRQVQPDPFAGLWIGAVSVNQVQEPALSVTTETPAPFRFQIILHVDSMGNVRLLNEVTLLWRDGTYKPDPQPDMPNAKSMDEPGRYILVTPTAPVSLLNELWVGEDVHPVALKDGRPFTRRISTAMFSLLDENKQPETPLMDKSGSFGQDGSQLTIELVLEDSDPLNPFHHRYHPLHAYPEEGEPPTPNNDWTINRLITLEFDSTPPQLTGLAGWGDTLLGGVYTEVLEGLKKESITVVGEFTLQQLADIPELNDGLTQ